MYIYVCMYIYICMYIYMYIYLYVQRESLVSWSDIHIHAMSTEANTPKNVFFNFNELYLLKHFKLIKTPLWSSTSSNIGRWPPTQGKCSKKDNCMGCGGTWCQSKCVIGAADPFRKCQTAYPTGVSKDPASWYRLGFCEYQINITT